MVKKIICLLAAILLLGCAVPASAIDNAQLEEFLLGTPVPDGGLSDAAEAEDADEPEEETGDETEAETVIEALSPASGHVMDEAGLIDASEEAVLEAMIDSIRGTYQVDAYILTTYDMPTDNSESGRRSWEWVNNYYDKKGYGLGDDKAGFLFVIDMHNRWPVLSTNGIVNRIVTSSRSESIFDLCDSYLPYKNYGGCCKAVLRTIDGWLAEAVRNGSLYYDEAGTRSAQFRNPLTKEEILLSLLAGCAVAGVIAAVVHIGYSLKGGTYKFDAVSASSRNLVVDEQQHINHHVTRVRLPEPSSSGGGGRSFSGGGGGHGGGTGHHF